VSPLLLAPLLLAALFVGWIAVQSAWRRSFEFDRDTDVLADRCGCAACPAPDRCPSRRQSARDEHDPIVVKEEGHGH